ncbi:hypothetical protein MNB_ARC-1_954 [hydrothermal vent metagenome]|uniref:RND efflux pump membrane fusion protein barrel-sandwich domain-containing protein n=1 Tax=hydrothermal vent metagenome TaxID=652676 RepID=A0A3B1E4Q1_9ZZZZ
MIKILAILLFSLKLLATSYMGKIEPKNIVVVKSEVSGIVKQVKQNARYNFVKNDNLVLLDTAKLDIEVNSLTKEVQNQKKVFKIKEKRYKSKAKISTISNYEKAQEELAMRQALQNLYGLSKQLKLKQLEQKKHIFSIKNKYVGNIYVRENDFVSMGSMIMDIYDISESKITIFVSRNDIENIKDKDIYIDGNKSDYKITFISKITDKIYISSYKVEISRINKDENMLFGKVVTVDFK